jgi:antitoxin PrlF
MPTTLNSNGRITVPKAIRDYLGLRTGSAVTFERLLSGEVVIRAATSQTKLSGSVCAKLRGRMNTEEIMALTRGA